MRFTLRALAFVPVLLGLVLLTLSCGGGTSLARPTAAGYTLVWSDEFSGPDGSAPDSSKWNYDTGGKG